MHPLRRDAPDQKRCNAYGSGVSPPTTSTTAGNSPPQTPTVHLGRCDTASTCSPGSEREALHPLRRNAPDQKGCNAYRSGAPPPTTSTTADTPSPQTPTGSIGRSHTASTCSPRLRTRGATPVTSRCTRSVAMHPLRRATPVTSQCTRYVAIHPIRRGAMPTDRVHRLPQQAQPRAIRPHRPQPSAPDAATQLRHARPAPNERRCTRYVAIHPLRRNAPVTSQCTRSEGVQCLRIGCTAT